MQLRPGQVVLRRGPLVVRAVKVGDVQPLHRHIKELVRERAQILLQHVPTLKEERAFVREKVANLGRMEIFLVAEWDGRVAGVGSAHRDMVKPHATARLAMLGLGVSPGFRRKGVGEALLRAAMRCARKEWGTRIFWLDVYRSNTAAQKLYRRLGFRVTGRVPRGAKVRGKITDVLLMVRG
ncbi:MAG TPA: N-acetyltransferase [archaeon]|nr:N-acetyltransferase [archaeon]